MEYVDEIFFGLPRKYECKYMEEDITHTKGQLCDSLLPQCTLLSKAW